MAEWYTKLFLDKGSNVTALDLSSNMVEMTKRRVGNRDEIIRADLNDSLANRKMKMNIQIYMNNCLRNYSFY